MNVYKYAEEFLEEEENAKRYKDFDKYLIFDCDDPKNIEDVIQKMLDSEHGYKLLLTNLLFEVWLLMHFEVVDTKLGKRVIYKKMADYLGCLEYNSKEKANEGNIRKIIGDSKNVKNSIINAKNLEREYNGKCDELVKNIKTLNPYTKMHSFIEKVLYEIDNMNQKS